MSQQLRKSVTCIGNCGVWWLKNKDISLMTLNNPKLRVPSNDDAISELGN